MVPLLNRQIFGLLVMLGVASALCVGLMVTRVCVAWKLTHCYLVWNLILAWMPLLFALLAWRNKDTKWKLLTYGTLWLLFFPNAPYLVTDLLHLREKPPVPLWFDIILLQSFIWLGLLLGFVSLHSMQQLVARNIGSRGSWFFVFVVVSLTGFGMYLGRVERWNSWDAIVSPVDLGRDVLSLLFPPRRRMAGVFTILHSAFLLVAYLLFHTMTSLRLHFANALDQASTAHNVLISEQPSYE